MRFKLFPRIGKQKTPRPATSGDQLPGRGTAAVFDPTWHISAISTHDDIAMSAIQTALAVLKEGSSLATKLPFITPVAGLILQVLTMRDEVKQCQEECETVMRKLARVARVILNVCELCEKHNLSEEELPVCLRAVLGSLQRELDQIEWVLKKCSKRKGIKYFLLRKNLLAKIKQCDGELSNVLQTFQVELGLDIRFALIVQRGEAASDSGTNGATPAITQGSNVAQGTGGTWDALWHITLNAKELIVRPSEAILRPVLLPNAIQPHTKLLLTAFFGSEAGLV